MRPTRTQRLAEQILKLLGPHPADPDRFLLARDLILKFNDAQSAPIATVAYLIAAQEADNGRLVFDDG